RARGALHRAPPDHGPHPGPGAGRRAPPARAALAAGRAGQALAHPAPPPHRLPPGPALTLVPLLVLDRLLGWEDARDYGRLVHLQGHLFVLAGLALVALA